MEIPNSDQARTDLHEFNTFRALELDAEEYCNKAFDVDDEWEKHLEAVWERRPNKKEYFDALDALLRTTDPLGGSGPQIKDIKYALEADREIKELQDALDIIEESKGNKYIRNPQMLENARRDLGRGLEDFLNDVEEYRRVLSIFEDALFVEDTNGEAAATQPCADYVIRKREVLQEAINYLAPRIDQYPSEYRNVGSVAPSDSVPVSLRGKDASDIVKPPSETGKIQTAFSLSMPAFARLRLDSRSQIAGASITSAGVKRGATDDGIYAAARSPPPKRRSLRSTKPPSDWSGEETNLEAHWNGFLQEGQEVHGFGNWIQDFEIFKYRAVEMQREQDIAVFPPTWYGHYDGSMCNVLSDALVAATKPWVVSNWKEYLDKVHKKQGREAYNNANRYYGLVLYDVLVNDLAPPLPDIGKEWVMIHRADVRREKSMLLGFATDQLGSKEKWRMVTELGSGGQGFAILWLKTDEEDNIIDKVVLKDSYVDKRQWASSDFWYDEETREIPLDVAAQDALSKVDVAPRCSVYLRTHSVYHEIRMYRVYSEYCPHGDLDYVHRAHADLQKVHGKLADSQRYRIPPAALWCIFRALVKAAFLMHYGSPPNAKGIPQNTNKGWERFVHCDIKPANVFLASIDESGSWPGIPMPRLGDYGCVWYMHKVTPGTTPGGTHGFMAPEQLVREGDGYERFVVSNWSDVWGIGRTMQDLIEIGNVYDTADVKFGTDTEHQTFSADAWSTYPLNLLELVEKCLTTVPTHRITVQELWQEITRICTREDEGESLISRGLEEGDQFLYVTQDRLANWGKPASGW